MAFNKLPSLHLLPSTDDGRPSHLDRHLNLSLVILLKVVARLPEVLVDFTPRPPWVAQFKPPERILGALLISKLVASLFWLQVHYLHIIRTLSRQACQGMVTLTMMT